jgi:ribosomal peptide maturation radical SAM protein 1
VKSPENVLKTLRHYRDRFGADRFEAVDNNLSMGYFETFLPRIRGTFPEGVSIYYNVKVNMSRAQIKALADSGVTLALAGIENLSDHVLKLMYKGASAMQNVFFLKCARQYGVFVLWNMMLGVFGETQGNCDEIAALVPKILHLCPPTDPYRMMQVHRFSRYWKEKSRWFEEIGPAGWYRYIFPEDFDLERIAYYFDVKPRAGLEPANPDGVASAVSEWRRRWMFDEEPRFFYREEGTRTLLYDLRPEQPVKIMLSPLEAALYHLLDDIVSEREILEKSSGLCEPEEAERILEEFVTHGFAMRSGDLYLGLALRDGFRIWTRAEKISVELTREAKRK